MLGRTAVLLLSVLLFASGCATAPRAINPTLILHWDKSKNPVSSFHFTGGLLGSATLDGVASVGPDATWTVILTRLEWFNNWPNGWTQATFLLDGTGVLYSDGNSWTLRIEKMPSLDVPENASIRYFDTYVRGDNGLAEFSHRWERIQAVTADLLIQKFQPLPGSKAFEQYLFPEVYGYSSPSQPGQNLSPVLGIEWNKKYTEDHFPERLWAPRNSGSLYRDYQESPGLWYLAMAWAQMGEPGKEIQVQIRK